MKSVCNLSDGCWPVVGFAKWQQFRHMTKPCENAPVERCRFCMMAVASPGCRPATASQHGGPPVRAQYPLAAAAAQAPAQHRTCLMHAESPQAVQNLDTIAAQERVMRAARHAGGRKAVEWCRSRAAPCSANSMTGTRLRCRSAVPQSRRRRPRAGRSDVRTRGPPALAGCACATALCSPRQHHVSIIADRFQMLHISKALHRAEGIHIAVVALTANVLMQQVRTAHVR